MKMNKFFDAASLPQDAVKIKLNKPNLRHFEVVKSCYDHEESKFKEEEHIFTSDSFKKAIKIAYKSRGEEYYIELFVYEADGITKVCRLNEWDIEQLYKIREYLK